ncbi:MAG: carbonic anhydrase [Planctomycetota bacterium]
MTRITAEEALRRLKDGNRRFVSGTPRTSFPRRPELADGQDPFAIVLGCADSRVPVETVFDQGPGDLFVVRIAGHAILPALLGSVEIAVAHLDAAVIVVLGHTNCAAVGAALGAPEDFGAEGQSPADWLASHIRPLVEGLSPEEAVVANVRGSIPPLRAAVPGIREKDLPIVGAVYDVSTREVGFLED